MSTSTESVKINPIIDSIIEITNNKAMVLDGPLSKQCSDALLEVYKKEVDAETGISLECKVALETQVNDAIVSGSYWLAAKHYRETMANTGKEVGMIYGVSEAELGPSHIVSIIDNLSNMTDVEKENSLIVIDSKVDPSSSEVTTEYARAIEEIAKENNVEFFASLEAMKAKIALVNGVYKGKQTGYDVTFRIGEKTHKVKTQYGLRGKNIPVTVTVKNNAVFKVTH